MGKIRTSAIALFFALLLGSCAKEGNVASETAPQVENHKVSLSFFEETIESISANAAAKTRAGDSEASPLKNAHLYSDLQVCLIPKDNPNNVSYLVSQDSTSADFGKVELSVPYGEYTLIAVAAKTNLQQTKRVSVLSTTEVTFPDNMITDMAYASQDITIAKEELRKAENVALKRGVSSFMLTSSDKVPDNAASVEFVISGGCGKVFDPSTGFCKSKETITKTLNIEDANYKGKIVSLAVYALLSSNDQSDINVTATMKDNEGNVIKVCSFTDVHLVIGKRTKYKGPIFSFPADVTFSISDATLEDSGYGKTF